MSIADYIALGIIIFLMFCAVRYMISSKGRHGCSGCCHKCVRSCAEKEKENIKKM